MFTLLDRTWVTDITAADPATMPMGIRHGLERVLDLTAWLDLYRPEVLLP